MKLEKTLGILIVALWLMVWAAQVSEATPVGTAFTYQGLLYDANRPADGQYDFQFKLWRDPCRSEPLFKIGDDVNKPDVDVIDGYFTVELDFSDANAFSGAARWLEIGVRPGDLNDPNVYTVLSPRQEVTPTPYAMYAERAGGGDNLGNHTATQNINLNGNYLSGDGGDEGVYVASDGKVGIGTSGPGAKLAVDGDLKVTGAYKGNISSSSGSDGAPFPRPAYDSGWVAVAQASQVTLTHNIGGNVDNYVVNMQFKDPVTFGVNNLGYGLYNSNDGNIRGAYYHDLTTTSIKVVRATNDINAPQVRVRIWVYN